MDSSDINGTGHDSISLANLVLDEKYQNNGGRVILLYRTGTIQVAPAKSLQYLDVKSNLEFEELIDSKSETNITLVTQDYLDVKFSLDVCFKDYKTKLLCDIYYDNTSDNLVIHNKSDKGIDIRLEDNSKQLLPRLSHNLGVGTHEVNFNTMHVLDFRVLPRANILDITRRMAKAKLPAGNLSRKRALPEADCAGSNTLARQTRHDIGDRTVTLLAESPHEISSPSRSSGNYLVDLAQHGAVTFIGVANYEIYKRKILSKQTNSEVYLAEHSEYGEIVVKVLKRPNLVGDGRSLRMQAQAWKQEHKIHHKLDHVCIPNCRIKLANYLERSRS